MEVKKVTTAKLNAKLIALKNRYKAAVLHTRELIDKVAPELIVRRATWMYPYDPDELKQYHQIIGLAVKLKKWHNKGNTKQLDKLEQLGIEFLQARKTTKKEDAKNEL